MFISWKICGGKRRRTVAIAKATACITSLGKGTITWTEKARSHGRQRNDHLDGKGTTSHDMEKEPRNGKGKIIIFSSKVLHFSGPFWTKNLYRQTPPQFPLSGQIRFHYEPTAPNLPDVSLSTRKLEYVPCSNLLRHHEHHYYPLFSRLHRLV